jgi:cobalt-zinc-cadmium resistance protein CzcA
VRDVATVHVGRELRTGSASENGEEVVVGTVLMLIGCEQPHGGSQAVDAGWTEINAARCRQDIEARTVLNRTKLVNATINTVSEEPGGRRGARHRRIARAVLGNFRAALICALAIPLSMLMTAIGMVQTQSAAT